MVPHLAAAHHHDLHIVQGPAIPQHPRLHHLQEFDNHLNRLRRGAVVWRLRHPHGAILVRSHGRVERCCRVGGYQRGRQLVWP